MDLERSNPINEWKSDRLVEMPTGIHRHEIVFVAYTEGIYAIKEMLPRLSRHEFEILRSMEGRTRHTVWLSDVLSRHGLTGVRNGPVP